ncbi:cobalamin-dependent protein [Desulfobacula sp.]|uniref:cobalamin B12-binding domain-containing protein n=1 Tax=Desulfobacula sp. TaxID=2593537 RepID=UPI00263146D8|nr:cobalamin-dependent protein [Desulfobacula sp.]
MTREKKLIRLSTMIAALDEEKALAMARQLISDGMDPLQIIAYSHKGITEVGLRYERGIYFISGLIMAGEIMEQISQMVLPLTMGSSLQQGVGRILIGTVEGDIHYIGKDIFKAFLRGHGFAVHDLGVDVSKATFLSAVHEYKPDIVGFSCLISTCLDTLKETIAHLKIHVPQGLAPRAYLAGGHLMSKRVCKAVGADLCTTDSMEGIRLCQTILSG